MFYKQIVPSPIGLCYTVSSYWFISGIHSGIYIYQPQFPSSFPILPLGINTFLLYVSVSISAMQVGLSVHFFSRFYAYALIYDIWDRVSI